MVYRVIFFITRKPHVSFEVFKEHYESYHVPMVQKLAAEVPSEGQPISYTRKWLMRDQSDADTKNPNRNPGMMGNHDFTFDVVTELVFQSKEAAKVYETALYAGGKAGPLMEDEEKYHDWSKSRSYVVEEHGK
eukprot:Phypoly_transcript_27887.p1 GENE.Phypoly_transcript_27887~~Phypoly_transcript_27887.p1  ORF type:complete len:133 (+),score=12.49 Phypoly_transcript_27887:64-462(+)